VKSASAFDRYRDYRDYRDCDPVDPGCFLRGTRLLTPRGERKVEDLEIGDAVVTSGGESRIQWIGRRLCLRKSNKEVWADGSLPVRFSRGALAPSLPHSDLWVSPKHALLIDGLLIQAVELVNGTSITIDSCENSTEIEYLHIKIADPNFIFAEGVPSESLAFTDRFSLGAFDNSEEFHRSMELPRLQPEAMSLHSEVERE
jgi:hypothetical protein